MTDLVFFSMLNSKLSLAIVVQDDLGSFEIKKNLKPILNMDLGQNTELQSFDFANYDLGSMGRAIGVRTTIHACGAGGSICSNEEKRLYTLNTPQIREVLSSTIGYFGVYAGDWHHDGTRDHFSEELAGVVIIQSEKNKLSPPILIKTTFRGKVLQRLYLPKKTRQNLELYQRLDPEIFPRVDRYQSFQDLEDRISLDPSPNGKKHSTH